MADRVARALTADGMVRGLAAVTTDLVEDARARHGTLPTATAALGRALTAALLLGGLLKTDDERVSLQFSGDGPLGGILVDATAEGVVRGFVSRPQTHVAPRGGKLDVGGALGRGLLCVMRVPVGEGPPYRSVVPLVSGEIGSDVANYLAGSEQIPSAVALGVFVNPDGRVGAAGGYLLQSMPGADPRAVERLEENVGTSPPPSELVRSGLDARSMLAGLLNGVTTHVLEEHPVRFACRCNRARVESAILAMGRAEVLDVLAGERRAEVVCEFCAARYVVEEPELRALLAASDNA
ncbi:MAG TPA: Hsp33 family molecular chaperone HslO [Candidatus Binatus sp.]|nr:Hsp33 family molecular chaperone HslO [Candidatus Binatus sp.]